MFINLTLPFVPITPSRVEHGSGCLYSNWRPKKVHERKGEHKLSILQWGLFVFTTRSIFFDEIFVHFTVFRVRLSHATSDVIRQNYYIIGEYITFLSLSLSLVEITLPFKYILWATINIHIFLCMTNSLALKHTPKKRKKKIFFSSSFNAKMAREFFSRLLQELRRQMNYLNIIPL